MLYYVMFNQLFFSSPLNADDVLYTEDIKDAYGATLEEIHEALDDWDYNLYRVIPAPLMPEDTSILFDASDIARSIAENLMLLYAHSDTTPDEILKHIKTSALETTGVGAVDIIDHLPDEFALKFLRQLVVECTT